MIFFQLLQLGNANCNFEPDTKLSGIYSLRAKPKKLHFNSCETLVPLLYINYFHAKSVLVKFYLFYSRLLPKTPLDFCLKIKETEKF